MLKKILYAVVCFTVFAACLLPLTSCGSQIGGMGIDAQISKTEYFQEGDYSTLVASVEITNHNEGYVLTACSVKLNFRNADYEIVDSKMATFTDIHVDHEESEYFSAVYDPSEGTEAVKGEIVSVISEPYSMTLEKIGGDSGLFWSVLGGIGAVIGVIFVAGVIWGVFFD